MSRVFPRLLRLLGSPICLLHRFRRRLRLLSLGLRRLRPRCRPCPRGRLGQGLGGDVLAVGLERLLGLIGLRLRLAWPFFCGLCRRPGGLLPFGGGSAFPVGDCLGLLGRFFRGRPGLRFGLLFSELLRLGPLSVALEEVLQGVQVFGGQHQGRIVAGKGLPADAGAQPIIEMGDPVLGQAG